jgi:hypothetical protein
MYEWIVNQLQTNQFMTGAIGGSISFAVLNYIKSWLSFVMGALKNFFVREITLLSATHKDFYDSFCAYTSRYIKHPKNIKISHADKEIYISGSNKRGGTWIKMPPQTKRQAGYGSHWFWYNWYTFVRVVISLDSDNHTESKTESIYVYFLGLRPRSMRNRFYEEFLKSENANKPVPHYHKFNEWGQVSKTRPIKNRPIESIFTNQEHIAKIDSVLSTINIEDVRFTKLGRSKNVGIMLYGKPGTGKTSLIHAFASKYEKDLYFVDFNNKNNTFQSILETISHLPAGTIIVLEDIDCHECTHVRSENNDQSGELVAVLRMLDCINLPDNAIVFATTNNLEILDPALTRPGRFDLVIHMDYADRETAQRMIEYVDPSKLYLLDQIEYPISQAKLQAMILDRYMND